MLNNKFSYLTKIENSYSIVKKKSFIKIGTISKDNVKKAEEFSHRMTYGKEGEHRNHRTGGSYRRSPQQIYENTLHGKLSEFALYEFFVSNDLEMGFPDLDAYPLGKWDAFDFNVKSKKLNVKSTKHFGNLLLLEFGDWNKDAEYIPNIDKHNHIYDYFILIRLRISPDDVIYDIPGYITKEDLIFIINNNYILPKNSLLNGSVKMDAENYYVQSGDMREINGLIKTLQAEA